MVEYKLGLLKTYQRYHTDINEDILKLEHTVTTVAISPHYVIFYDLYTESVFNQDIDVTSMEVNVLDRATELVGPTTINNTFCFIGPKSLLKVLILLEHGKERVILKDCYPIEQKFGDEG